MPRERVIFFDIGQTLVTGNAQSARRLLAAQLHLTEKQTKRVGKLIMTQAAEEPTHLLPPLQALLPHLNCTELSAAVQNVWHMQWESVREIPGAMRALESLRTTGYRLGVLSNTWHPFYQGLCHKYPEFEDLVHYKILSYQRGFKKPSPDIFREALKKAGEEPSLCWMVGDTYELDMEPALRAGMRTLWILHSPQRERSALVQVLQGEKPAPHWTVESLDEVLEFFQRKGS